MKESKRFALLLLGAALTQASTTTYAQEQAPQPLPADAPVVEQPAPEHSPGAKKLQLKQTTIGVGVGIHKANDMGFRTSAIKGEVRAEHHDLSLNPDKRSIKEIRGQASIGQGTVTAEGYESMGGTKPSERQLSLNVGYGLGKTTRGLLKDEQCRLYAMAAAEGEASLRRYSYKNSPPNILPSMPMGSLETSLGGQGGIFCSVNGIVVRAGAGPGLRYAETMFEGGTLRLQGKGNVDVDLYDRVRLSAEHAQRSDSNGSRVALTAKPLSDKKIPVYLGMEWKHDAVSTQNMKLNADTYNRTYDANRQGAAGRNEVHFTGGVAF